jgi:hypothetical protein
MDISSQALVGPNRQAHFTGTSRQADLESKATFKLPVWVWLIAAALAIWGFFGANPLLTPAAIAVLIVSIQLLWRSGEPPVLVFACGMQWLQASAVIFYIDFYKVPLATAGGGQEFEVATWLSLIAVFVLALGMRLALIRCRRSQHAALVASALRINIANAFVAYLITFAVATVVERTAFAVPQLTQVIYSLVTLKWVAVFILAYSTIEQRSGYIFLVVIMCIEVTVGVLGFFSDFKSVFFLVLVVAMTSPFALRGRRLAISLVSALALFFFGVVWSAIKVEYREFLNQGSGEQVVTVSVEDSATKFSDLVGNLTWENFTGGFESMILRVGYTDFFARTIANVPNNVPYEHGALWLGALEHIVTPRLLFPEKATISDSERTMLYTGVDVGGAKEGTSIGIGYVAESYVDFGPVFMFTPIFLLGVFYGLIYRVFVIRSDGRLIPAAIASSILIFGAYTIETSNIKIVGGIVTHLLVIGTMYLLFGRAFKTWLEHGLK